MLQGQVPQAQVPSGQAVPQSQGGFVDTIRRHEVDAVLNNQNQLLATARELRCVHFLYLFE